MEEGVEGGREGLTYSCILTRLISWNASLPNSFLSSFDRDKEWEKVWKKSLPGVDYKCLCVQREQKVPSVLCFNFQTFQLKPWHNVSSEYTWLE